ncbi:MAG: ribosome recycling factor [bacterium]
MEEKAFTKGIEEKMRQSISIFQKELIGIRTGRANPAIVEEISVDYYGTPTPLYQIAKITTPDSRTILIQPWDRQSLTSIEKAILKSNLSLTPINDGTSIKLNIPSPTEERRRELVKLVKKKGEDAKVVIRNIRRSGIEELEKEKKNNKLPEDVEKRIKDQLQKITDKYIEEVDKILQEKEKEIMEV